MYPYMYTLQLHFSPPFFLLQHEYLDKVLNAIQQDLLVNLFYVVSDKPKLLIPPTPSPSHQAATSLFSKSMILESSQGREKKSCLFCFFYMNNITNNRVNMGEFLSIQ